MSNAILISSFVVLASAVAVRPVASGTLQETSMPKNAQEYLNSFKHGGIFTAPSTGVIVDGKPDPTALQLLGEDLAVDTPQVREQIVALLVNMGVQSDPLTPKGADVLRDQQIISLLANAGLAKPDLGGHAAMDALRNLVTQRDLANFGDQIAKALESAPSGEALLLVAKAKPPGARPVVDKLAQSPKWKDAEDLKIARAALGAQNVEDQFLAAADAAKDGEALAQALGTLALVGTPRSLKAIAERLRTPLTIDRQGAFKMSVRISVLNALLYNFPDQPVLYPNNIRKEEDYTAAEQFCVKTFGVMYTNPPPPFLTYRGYPIPLPR